MTNETKAQKIALVDNAAPIVGRNAAGSADIEIARVNAADAVELGHGSAPIEFGGGPINSTGTGNAHVKFHAAGNGDAELHAVSGCLSLETTTGPVEIATTNHARTVEIATGNADQLVTVGSDHGASSMTIHAGTGNLNIGTFAADRTVAIANGAANQTVTLGSTHGTSSLTLDAGSGALNIGTSGTSRTISIGTGATNAQTINIATGAAPNLVTIGSTNGAATTTIQSGTGYINATNRFYVKANSGFYVLDNAGAFGINVTGQSSTTHTVVGVGTTTTLRMSTALEMNNSITALTDKAPSIGALDKRFSTITCQTTQEKTHDAFAGSAHVTATAAVQTTNNTTTTLYTSPTLLDESATWVEVHVAGHDTGGTNRGYAVRRALFTRDGGGGASRVGSTNDAYSNLPGTWGGGVPLTAVDLDANGNTFRVRVQGTGATINWTVTVRYQTVSQNT